jgi:hypothetical protein
MSEISRLDLKGPATLKAVVEALVHLGRLDESEILEMTSAGRLEDLFPFQPVHGTEAIADFMPDDALVEASPLPLNEQQRTALVEASMPSPRTFGGRSRRNARTRR